MENGKKKDCSQSTANALRILDCFIDKEERGISELSRELDLGKASVSRLVAALEQNKFLMKNASTGKYRLGIRLMLFGSLAQERNELARAASPVMQTLTEKYQTTTHLAMLYGTDVMIVHKLSAGPFMYMSSRVGATLRAHATATGKCILAFSSTEQVEGFLKHVQLEPLTSSTITDVATFLEELESIRLQGYAVDDGEYMDGLYCIPVPLLDMSNKAIASISISGQKALLFGRLDEITRDLIKVTRQLSIC